MTLILIVSPDLPEPLVLMVVVQISQQIMLVLIQQNSQLCNWGWMSLQSATAVDTDTADANKDETDYLIHLSPNADRITTAGEEVTITITPVDKAGNTGTPVTHKIKLAASDAAPTAVGTIAAQTLTAGAAAVTVNVADKFSDPNDTLTYSAVSSDYG